jgi:citrate lyase subunit beta/citryl-CoA lyase
VIAAFDGAAGVASLDGQMLDRPHLVLAEKVIARAKAAGV